MTNPREKEMRKSNHKLKTAQHYMKGNGMAMSGFNHRVFGDTYQETFAYPQRPNADMHAGWQLADDMIMAGKIYYIHNFHSTHNTIGCKGHAFDYGGYWVCNSCGRQGVDEEWWKIKVMPDGDACLCVGIDFENLQESDCYAFGKTRDEAIKNYGDLMLTRST